MLFSFSTGTICFSRAGVSCFRANVTISCLRVASCSARNRAAARTASESSPSSTLGTPTERVSGRSHLPAPLHLGTPTERVTARSCLPAPRHLGHLETPTERVRGCSRVPALQQGSTPAGARATYHHHPWTAGPSSPPLRTARCELRGNKTTTGDGRDHTATELRRLQLRNGPSSVTERTQNEGGVLL